MKTEQHGGMEIVARVRSWYCEAQTGAGGIGGGSTGKDEHPEI